MDEPSPIIPPFRVKDDESDDEEAKGGGGGGVGRTIVRTKGFSITGSPFPSELLGVLPLLDDRLTLRVLSSLETEAGGLGSGCAWEVFAALISMGGGRLRLGDVGPPDGNIDDGFVAAGGL